MPLKRKGPVPELPQKSRSPLGPSPEILRSQKPKMSRSPQHSYAFRAQHLRLPMATEASVRLETSRVGACRVQPFLMYNCVSVFTPGPPVLKKQFQLLPYTLLRE